MRNQRVVRDIADRSGAFFGSPDSVGPTRAVIKRRSAAMPWERSTPLANGRLSGNVAELKIHVDGLPVLFLLPIEDASPKSFHVSATSSEITYARIGQAGLDRSAHGRQVFDVTGAGDTVLSVLALAVAAHVPIREAAVLANAGAGVVVGKLGTSTITPGELIAAVREVD